MTQTIPFWTHPTSRPTLGILGGAGPLIAAQLQCALLGAHQQRTGAWRDADFPAIVSVNTALAGVDGTGVADGAALQVDLARTWGHLEKLGAQRIIVPCASAHPYLMLGQATVVDWLGLGARRMRAMGPRIGVVASASSTDGGLFHDLLERVGAQCVVPQNMPMVTALIEAGMRGYYDARHHHMVRQITQELERAEVDGVWWACTELSFLPQAWLGERHVQSMGIMVDAALGAWA